MAFDLEEQEQLDNLKAFWSRWGTFLTVLIVGGTLAFLSWKGYGWYQNQQSAKAAALYEQFNQAVEKKDASQAARLTDLQTQYPKARYAALASFAAAEAAKANSEWDKAQTPLQWVIGNSTVDNQSTARLMLADIQAQMGKTDEAIKTLDTVPVATYTAAFANKKSDIYVLAKDPVKARAALEQAIAAIKPEDAGAKELLEVLKQKLNFLPKP